MTNLSGGFNFGFNGNSQNPKTSRTDKAGLAAGIRNGEFKPGDTVFVESGDDLLSYKISETGRAELFE